MRIVSIDSSTGARPTGAQMIKLDTTFVVGAGASFDYGFPLGEPLTRRIAGALNFEDPINFGPGPHERELIRTAIDVFCKDDESRQQLFLQRRALRDALTTASSIDTFLESHPDFELLGKIAIAACLIRAEGRSNLKPRPGKMIDLAAVENSWLGRLFKFVMVPGVSNASIQQIFAQVSFVVFNYDRCIEHYFQHAIASYFMVDLSRAADIVKHLRIVHPYGDLGALHSTDTNVSFGHEYQPETYEAGAAIHAMSQRLRTFTESKKAQGADARDLIRNARRVVFLGFGFGEQNVELLRSDASIVQDTRATGMGLSKSNQREVQRRISTIIARGFDLGDLHECDCTTLINDEQMFLRGT
jgi:hypothetical protein